MHAANATHSGMPGRVTPWPSDPIAAVTYPDPHPYYAQLTAQRPLYRDDSLGLWVASSAAAVTAVLTSDICRVRPPSEPVPKAIAGSPTGEIFRQLVRMNDGESHCPFKRAIVATLDAVDAIQVARHASERAATLAHRLSPQRSRDGLTRFMFAIPVETLASLLGVRSGQIEEVAAWASDYVAAVSPIADAGEIEAGKRSAQRLTELFNQLLTEQERKAQDTLLATLARQAQQAGRTRETIIANAIGFMSQSYEATAGLIGNTLLTLAAHQDVLSAVRARPALVRQVVQEVLRFDPPTQSTRRFLARDGVVAGQSMRAGDAILVLLAAAGRDPAINGDPGRFDIDRPNRKILNFGAGVHACPADAIAPRIAEVAVAHLLGAGLDLGRLREETSYRRSVAIRMPVFGNPN